jgi:ATP-dependent DNA helicase DinG
MVLLEAAVHSSLRAFLREQGRFYWSHHLTMGRLVARALRLKRSSLMQTGTTLTRYCLSYLTPSLLGDTPVLIVAPESEINLLWEVEIPNLQAWLQTKREILKSDRFPANFTGLLLTTPQQWLKDRLGNLGHFPQNIPTIIDRAEDLETWVVDYLTVTITPEHWFALQSAYPQHREVIDLIKAQLGQSILSHPINPYNCYLIDAPEKEYIIALLQRLESELVSDSDWQLLAEKIKENNYLLWTSVDREQEEFTLKISPLEVASFLQPIWTQQPFVLIGSFLDSDKSANLYRQNQGLGTDILTLKFTADRESEYIHLYLPDRLSPPNTPEFQPMLLKQVRELINANHASKNPIIILIEDVPLKARIAAQIAADYGSRVQVEKTEINGNTILVCGWQFWQTYQENCPTPSLLIIATLPLPSPENPLVAGKISYYKRQHLDWFRAYLLPTAVREIQKSVQSLRECQGCVAVLDNRVNARSYGRQILSALEPYAKVNYIDEQFFQDKD